MTTENELLQAREVADARIEKLQALLSDLVNAIAAWEQFAVEGETASPWAYEVAMADADGDAELTGAIREVGIHDVGKLKGKWGREHARKIEQVIKGEE